MTPEVLQTHIARIDKALAENGRRREQIEDPIQYLPWLAMIGGMTAGAAFFGAGAALMKIFGG